jgi:hypothetical protein
MTLLLGLYREKACSPGRHESNDALLLDGIAEHLRGGGLQIELRRADGPIGRRNGAALVFSMCQGPAALDLLSRWEREGARIINSPGAALNTYRYRLPGLMNAAEVPYPQTRIIATHMPVQPPVDIDGGVWLKRGDLHASVSADVQWIDSAARLDEGLADFRTRGITRAVVQAHCPGDEVKFYGLADGSFFHWFYSAAPEGHPFDVAALNRLVSRAALAAGLDVFGGDVIVSSDGALTLIDLNDWPSFASCREPAAEAIARYLMRHVNGIRNPRRGPRPDQSAV